MPNRDINLSFFENTFSNGVRKTVSMLHCRSDIHGVGSSMQRSRSSTNQSRSPQDPGAGRLDCMGGITKIMSTSSRRSSRCSKVSYDADSMTSSPRMATMERGVTPNSRNSRSSSPHPSPQCSPKSPQQPSPVLANLLIEPTFSV
ncbi:unnamed protein product [Prorocentrum cordatum]|uniref:Uncharacterized protein n=1 Tax=Prorocentrum cordatum TaxID=2364126 RepID=A0ABN9XYS5_9DINO|nr:unnamed protein product [Polarella glacialis]